MGGAIFSTQWTGVIISEIQSPKLLIHLFNKEEGIFKSMFYF